MDFEDGVSRHETRRARRVAVDNAYCLDVFEACGVMPVIKLLRSYNVIKQEVKVICQKAPHGGPIPRLGVTPGGRNLYH